MKPKHLENKIIGEDFLTNVNSSSNNYVVDIESYDKVLNDCKMYYIEKLGFPLLEIPVNIEYSDLFLKIKPETLVRSMILLNVDPKDV
jgi:hypothetical protein